MAFLTVAVLSGLLGFCSLSGTDANISKILSLFFVAAFVVSLMMVRRRA